MILHTFWAPLTLMAARATEDETVFAALASLALPVATFCYCVAALLLPWNC